MCIREGELRGAVCHREGVGVIKSPQMAAQVNSLSLQTCTFP